tara:strand:+ start:147 stop:560 length:414 start_codon:yes stop_codon:yes gene_type:complete
MGLKLEAGKRYVTRAGWITPPICEDLEADEKGSVRFYAGDFSWCDEGTVFHRGEDRDDLLAEFVEVAPLPDVPDVYEYLVLAKMELYGGGFTKHLTIAYRHADSVNRQKIRNAFSEYWMKYAELAEVENSIIDGGVN